MILEEHIERLKTALTYLPTDKSEINITFNGHVLENLIHYLEDLKTLRVELERNSKELEVYKRALEIAVYTILDNGTHNAFTPVMYEATKETILEKALQKVREE